jgi:hypothetical protein
MTTLRSLRDVVLVAIALNLLVADVLFLVLPDAPPSVPLACTGNRGCPGDPAGAWRGTVASRW